MQITADARQRGQVRVDAHRAEGDFAALAITRGALERGAVLAAAAQAAMDASDMAPTPDEELQFGPLRRTLHQQLAPERLAERPHAEILAQVKDDSRVQFSPARQILVDPPSHATGPSMAQGASLAAEDVQVLTRELAGEASIDTALSRYATRRAPRTSHVHEATAVRNRLAAQPADPATLIRQWPKLSVLSFAALVPAPWRALRYVPRSSGKR